MSSNNDAIPLSPPHGTDELMMDPMEPCLSSQNYDEIFTKLTWFVDDTNIYNVIVHNTSDGKLTTKPVNGAIFILNPKTGHLFLKVIHPSVWACRKRVEKFIPFIASEEVASLLRPLPVVNQPNQIIVTREGLSGILEVYMLDFPNTVVRVSELEFPFQAFLKIETFGDVVLKATESEMVLFNIYDDWLESMSPFTAFSRLILILRAVDVDKDKVKMLLKPDKSVVTKAHHVWPSLSDDQWMKVEVALRDVIVTDYAEKKNVKASDLTVSEIRDIILGADITPSSLV
ncbi:unnamed protein product [Eruca vesicaria subsp. sativa]|uniref:PRP8 domain-containing protein n=1 Tax=Eruca vesicaria subsp. sativa TaxID=29727 RepID=A0ABC8J8F5_ERUVS|nr:unnamed protein product [Eruca vesicaria subsp. sativa]